MTKKLTLHLVIPRANTISIYSTNMAESNVTYFEYDLTGFNLLSYVFIITISQLINFMSGKYYLVCGKCK